MEVLLQHMTTKEIARFLGISPSTVEHHISAVRQKLGGADRNSTIRLYRELRESSPASAASQRMVWQSIRSKGATALSQSELSDPRADTNISEAQLRLERRLSRCEVIGRIAAITAALALLTTAILFALHSA